MINSETIKTGGWSAFFLLALFMAFGTLMLGNNWYIYFFLLASILAWTLYIVYVCESYITYMWSLLLSCVGGFTLPACVVAYGLTADVSLNSSLYRFLAGIAPALLVSIVYIIVIYTKPVHQPFEYADNRIQTRQYFNPKSSMNYSLPLIGGLTTLAASIFLKWAGMLTGAVVGMTIMTGGSIFILLYGRHVLRGLRTLRIQERNMPAPYTFMQLDEIRESRSRWWLGRLFKRVASWRKPSGA
ncbi:MULTISPECIES: hypothetical protein [Pseudomonas syringae group]|uniref:Uncharacterized protein n=3 Tax=Pseudomonas syringae group TaxID=136849 RepID=A0A3M2X3L6_PSEA0|nr:MULTISPECIES: hypothetical protein [Pseudomonas syringae group]EGH14421.1 hypothetical protein PSYMP_27663 [Pseudomonas amygdali pv. morsprunorum str. M302280]POC81937.1 hypothetical protein BKM26_27905 [Pseudomonas avellanae]POC99115.1 hypothetical protein BKM20_27990 [Pseudomonas avellanae]POD14025.1 hypothetical protein BKM05_26705 [Pseudomonas avellanae]POR70175.1 hypothetical protein BKM25_27015 [Pseudomonas avellanae]